MASRSIPVRIASIRPALQWAARYRESDGSLTYYPLILTPRELAALKVSGSPPNVSGGRFTDKEWDSEWSAQRLVVGEYQVFSTSGGEKYLSQLQEGEGFVRNGVLYLKVQRRSGRLGVLTFAQGDFEERGGKVSATSEMPEGLSVKDNLLERSYGD